MEEIDVNECLGHSETHKSPFFNMLYGCLHNRIDILEKNERYGFNYNRNVHQYMYCHTKTPLAYAVEGHAEDAARWLIQHGADPYKYCSNSRKTPMQLAKRTHMKVAMEEEFHAYAEKRHPEWNAPDFAWIRTKKYPCLQMELLDECRFGESTPWYILDRNPELDPNENYLYMGKYLQKLPLIVACEWKSHDSIGSLVAKGADPFKTCAVTGKCAFEIADAEQRKAIIWRLKDMATRTNS